MIGAGELDRRVTIRRATTTRDGYGQQINAWADAGSVWAKVDWVNDGEKWRAGELGVDLAARVTVRYSPGLVARQDRIAIDGEDYEVAGIKQIGRRQWLEITVTRAE